MAAATRGGEFMELFARGISHVYAGLRVLDGIDLHVAEGEVLAVIGPSGCGKSTLLNILGGLLQPTGGEVQTLGEPPAGCVNAFTYIFQDFSLLPWRSVEQNVALPLEHHKLPGVEKQARIADALRRMKLAEFRAALPKQLSGGMRQRVGIARALVVRPAILLLDEPLSALDAQTRELLMEDFLDLWLRDRTTAVYVTHNLAEALHLADRIAIFTRRPGRLREIVTVGIPRAERATASGKAHLAELHDRLWATIRDEALTADRELENV
jgi:NitT/TauT family transport system ATP-binding protein